MKELLVVEEVEEIIRKRNVVLNQDSLIEVAHELIKGNAILKHQEEEIDSSSLAYSKVIVKTTIDLLVGEYEVTISTTRR